MSQFIKFPAVEIGTRHSRYEGRLRVRSWVKRRFEVVLDPRTIRFMESNGDFTRIHSEHCTVDVAMSVDDVRDAVTKVAGEGEAA